MKASSFAQGDAVKVTSGPYKDAEGVVADIIPACDAVRLETKEGTAYAFIECMKPLPMPRPPKGALRRR